MYKIYGPTCFLSHRPMFFSLFVCVQDRNFANPCTTLKTCIFNVHISLIRTVIVLHKKLNKQQKKRVIKRNCCFLTTKFEEEKKVNNYGPTEN